MSQAAKSDFDSDDFSDTSSDLEKRTSSLIGVNSEPNSSQSLGGIPEVSKIPSSDVCGASIRGQFMPKQRQYGCWTCRLRRKKCDRSQPTCGACKSLSLECHQAPQSPEWMKDEGTRAAKLNAIRRQIKESTRSRNELKRAHAPGDTNESGAGRLFVLYDGNIIEEPKSAATAIRGSGRNERPTSRETTSDFPENGVGSALAFLREAADKAGESEFYTQQGVFETDFIAKYLDHVFPFLFPFYKPAIFETGRSWILSLLQHSKIALHSTLSLTAYFFTIALNDAYGSSYADCKDQVWHRLADQADDSFEDMHSTIQVYLTSSSEATVLDRIRMMESIVQILIFESIVGKSGDWHLHLKPAIALLEQVFDLSTGHDTRMLSALFSTGPPVWYKAENDSYIWSPDQAGFRFFAALLVYIDVVASTALGQAPGLAAMHRDMLGEDNGAPVLGFTRLRLSSVLGCQNDVLVAIGEIASLAASMSDQTSQNDDETIELHRRVARIDNQLDAIIALICKDPHWMEVNNDSDLSLQPYHIRATAKSPSTITTIIWAHAAKTYLLSVHEPIHDLIEKSTRHVRTITTLAQILPQNQFRTIAWPLCVAGCFAPSDLYQNFHIMFETKTELDLIGSPSEAWRVIQEVWKRRGHLDKNLRTGGFDMTLVACLGVFEGPVLLI